MALKSAKVADMDVQASWDKGVEWFEGAWNAGNPGGMDSMGSEDQSRFHYAWSGGADLKGAGRECIGLVSAVFQGRQNGDIPLETLANTVMAQDFPKTQNWPVNTYYMYYNTMGIFQVGGQRWKIWNSKVRDMLVAAQRKDGCFRGSWDFQGTKFHGSDTGRLLSTAYCCLSLEVYYRYQPVDLQKFNK